MLQPELAVDQPSPGTLWGFCRVAKPSHRTALEGDAVGVVEQAVEDVVAEGRIADNIVPVLDGDLAGQ